MKRYITLRMIIVQILVEWCKVSDKSGAEVLE